MKFKSPTELEKHVKTASPQGPALLYGSEDYLVTSWARRLCAPFESAGSFNMQRLDGRRINMEELCDAVLALPLMSASKCVLLEDVALDSLSSQEQDSLLELISDVPEGCLLLMTGRTGVFDQRLSAVKKLIAASDKHGFIADFSAPGPAELATFVRSSAQRHGGALDAELARYLLQICDNNMNSLESEIAKLCAYCGGEQITREAIDRIVTTKTEAKVFDLKTAILSGNAQKAMELIDGLFYMRESPVAISAVLIMAYADMYRARIARDRGASAADVAKRFAYKSEYRVKTAFSARLGVKELRRSLDVLLQCERRLKGAPTPGRTVMEQTVTELLLIAGGNRG